MNRSTRLVNPFTESTLFINPKTRHLTATLKSLTRISPSTTLLYSHRHRHRSEATVSISSSRRPMESENLSNSAIDDFVTVENPDPISVPADELSDDTTAIDSEDGGEREFRVDRENEVLVLDKPSLPEELSKNVVILSCENFDGDNCDVYLVGTAHVSQESCREVQAVISCLKPQVVFLELCSSRVAVLTLKDLKVPTMAEMIDSWKKNHNLFGILYSWFLAKVADKLEVLPGSEFRVAFEEAMRHESKVILGDRPVQITLRRTWGKMPLWHKIKLLYSLLFQAVFLPSPDALNKMLKEMDDVDMLTLVIQEMSKEFPTLMETLVNERDRYMSSTLLKVAREHTSVVAVVGKGHLQGIKRNWNQPVEGIHSRYPFGAHCVNPSIHMQIACKSHGRGGRTSRNSIKTSCLLSSEGPHSCRSSCCWDCYSFRLILGFKEAVLVTVGQIPTGVEWSNSQNRNIVN